MKDRQKIKVGPVTLALGLVVGGLTLLVYNFGGIDNPGWLWKFWPLLPVGLGVEYFVRRAVSGEANVNFHVPSILLVIILVLVGGSAVAVSGLNDKLGGLLERGLFYGYDSYQYSDTWDASPLEMKSGTDRLEISQQAGNVFLLTSEDGRLHVSSVNRRREGNAPDDSDREFNPQVQRKGNLVTVTVPPPPGMLKDLIKTDLTVEVPRDIPVKVTGKLGKVVGTDLQGDVTVFNGMGEIQLKSVKGNVEARTKSGQITITDPRGDVLARTEMGQLDFSSEVPLAGSYNLKSNLGSISFRVPEESNLAVDAVSSVGDINLMVPSGVEVASSREGPSDEAHFELGNGKGTAGIAVNTGSVEIAVR